MCSRRVQGKSDKCSLCKNGEFNAIISNDCNTLLFGCPYVMKDIDMLRRTYIFYNLVEHIYIIISIF